MFDLYYFACNWTLGEPVDKSVMAKIDHIFTGLNSVFGPVYLCLFIFMILLLCWWCVFV